VIDLKFTQQLLLDWGARCFGARHMQNRYKRALRAYEEVTELMQAVDVPQDKLVDVIRMVYAKKKGAPEEEIGHALGSLLMFCDNIHVDPEFALETTTLIALARDPVKMAERNAEKDALGL